MISFKKVESADDIAAVARLAAEIWPEHYTPIIGPEQVEYMVSRFQSAEAIASQIAAGAEYYLILGRQEPAGYFALEPDDKTREMYLSKLYVRKAVRGSGAGFAAMRFIEELCRDRGFGLIYLRVNKDNADSIAWYERQGFRKAGTVVSDIGRGFVMDDYRMEKQLQSIQ